MDYGFWTLKQYIQDWINVNDIKDCSVNGLGRGHKEVEVWLLKGQDPLEFRNKYNPIINEQIKGYIGLKYIGSEINPYCVYITVKKL